MKNVPGRWKKHLLACLLFCLLALGMTFPLVLHLSDHIPSDLGDPLYNVWAMAWDAHKLTTGWQGFWDANIFYPHHGTLLYADYLFALSLLAAPIAALSGSFILGYNVLFILSFFISALGMYYLVFHLTRSRAAALISGFIFAFFPYRFAHISHLELLYSAWIPFCFFFIHRFFENHSYKNLFGIGFFLVLQALSCAYYGVHLAFFSGIFILFFAFFSGDIFKKDFWLKAGILFLFCFLVLAPFFYPYIKVHQQMLFTRSINIVKHYSAQLQHFLAVPPWNLTWGRIAGSPGEQEWQLYPGIVPVVLSAFYWLVKRKKIPGRKFEKSRRKIFGSASPQNIVPIFYLLATILAWLLSLGPVIKYLNRELFVGPYRILYNWLPGFQGLRVPSRFVVMMMLGLSVMSGLAVARLTEKIQSAKVRILIPALLAVLLAADYISIPIPLAPIGTKKQVPPIYSLVRKLPREATLLELPIPARGLGKSREAIYIYYSLYHWKRLVNGYSGYIPPGYVIVGEAMESFPSEQTFKLLKNLRVEYLIVHTEWFLSARGEKIVALLENFPNEVSCLAVSQGDYLYRLLSAEGQKSDEETGNVVGQRQKWAAWSNSDPGQTKLAFDGNPETGWSTGHPQTEGDYFLLDLGSIQSMKELELSLHKVPLNFPRGFKLEASLNGRDWKLLAENHSFFPELDPLMIEDYTKYRATIAFPPCEVRYLRMTLTRSHRNRPWSIQEIVCRE